MSELINLGRIARLMQIDRQEFVAIARRAGSMYSRQILQIGTKQRVIDVPRPELKAIQRKVHDRVLRTIPCASAVYGIAGKGVIKNAQQHLKQPFMAILDIADCFPSITVAMIRHALYRAGFDDIAVRHITRLVTLRGRLPQGPPSSPAIMNIVLDMVDAELELVATAEGCVYTRYMDDICFSGDHDLSSLLVRARAILQRNGFRINKRKTRCWGPGDRHTVTKILVASSLSPTPEYLNALKNELKRSNSHMSLRDRNRLRAKIGWVRALNSALGKQLDRMSGGRRVAA